MHIDWLLLLDLFANGIGKKIGGGNIEAEFKLALHIL